jgi:hypothetical protein
VLSVGSHLTCGARWGRHSEEPRISAESRKLAPPQDRTGTANTETIPTASTPTTAPTGATKTTVMIAESLLLRADQVIE